MSNPEPEQPTIGLCDRRRCNIYNAEPPATPPVVPSGVPLDGDELLALARVLSFFTASAAGQVLADDTELGHFIKARAAIDKAAGDVVHESRVARREIEKGKA